MCVLPCCTVCATTLCSAAGAPCPSPRVPAHRAAPAAPAAGRSGAWCCCCRRPWCWWTSCSSWSAGGEAAALTVASKGARRRTVAATPACALSRGPQCTAPRCITAAAQVPSVPGIALCRSQSTLPSNNNPRLHPTHPSAASWPAQRRGRRPAGSCWAGCPSGCAAVGGRSGGLRTVLCGTSTAAHCATSAMLP